MVLVDSSVWIEAARKNGRREVKFALRGLLDEYEAAFCGPVMLEVLGGARKDRRKSMRMFFECLPYRGTGRDIWHATLKNAHKVRDLGINPKWNDLVIATIALRHKDRVFSIDKHFTEMAPVLGLFLYQPGYGGSYNPD